MADMARSSSSTEDLESLEKHDDRIQQSKDIEADGGMFEGEEKEHDSRDGVQLGNIITNGNTNTLRNALTHTSTKSSWKDPGPPPDGGWRAWSQGISRSPRLLSNHFEAGRRFGILHSLIARL